MATYVIVEVEVLNPEPYARYREMVMPSIELYGGRFLARGGRAELFEGENPPKRVVVMAFPSLERAREWWDSPEYRPARDLRQANSRARMIAVEGI